MMAATTHFVGAHASAGRVLRSMLPGDVNCPDCLSEMAAQDAAALPELLRLRKELGLTGPMDMTIEAAAARQEGLGAPR